MSQPSNNDQRVPLRLLVIGAHPADVFDQSGGTMAHHVRRGDWVGAVVLTHGARVHDKVIADEMFRDRQVPEAQELTALLADRADNKAQEVRRACEALGVSAENLYFLGVDDAVLLVEDSLVRRVARMIRKLRPNIIITHFPLEDGGVASPHATTGRIVMHALPLAASVDPGDQTQPHKVAQVFYFGIGAAPVRAHLWGGDGRVHERHVHQHHRRDRVEGRCPGRDGQPGLQRGLCPQADRSQ